MEADEVPQPTWWLYESLQFLLPYCKKDKGKSNLSKPQQVSNSEKSIENTEGLEDMVRDIRDPTFSFEVILF